VFIQRKDWPEKIMILKIESEAINLLKVGKRKHMKAFVYLGILD